MKENIYKIYPITPHDLKMRIDYEPEDDLADRLDTILSKHNVDRYWFFDYISGSLKINNFLPWCFIFFEEEYDIFEKIDSVRSKDEILCGSYAVMAKKKAVDDKRKTVSFIIIKSKAILEKLSLKSELFNWFWLQLKYLHSNGVYGYVSTMPSN